jgi:hypothetical protein
MEHTSGRGKWSRRFLAAVGVVGVSAALSGAVPADAHTTHAVTSFKPVAPELHQLDFMLGAWNCVNTVAFPGRPTVVNNLFVTGTPSVDGHWYKVDAYEVPDGVTPPLVSSWVFGWNAADAKFTAYYYDNNDSHGYAVSAGTSNGVVAFVGPYTSQDNFITTEDAFRKVDANHFVDDFKVNLVGVEPLIPAGNTACTRVGHRP